MRSAERQVERNELGDLLPGRHAAEHPAASPVEVQDVPDGPTATATVGGALVDETRSDPMGDCQPRGKRRWLGSAQVRVFAMSWHTTEQSQRGSNPCLHLERVVS